MTNDNTFTFREGTCDENVYRSVVELNEYHLPESLGLEWRQSGGATEERPIVIDIGGHIGSFAKACFDRDAAQVVSFEPEPTNCALLRKHLDPWIAEGRSIVRQTAVWRSDRVEYGLFHSGYMQAENEINTGAGDVIGSKGARVSTVPLDAVIGEVTGGDPKLRIRLLKLDCEGSEWPILLTSKRLARVDAICGEYHEIKEGEIPKPAKVGQHRGYSGRILDFWLTGNGFHFLATPIPDTHLGLFWAWRDGFEFAL